MAHRELTHEELMDKITLLTRAVSDLDRGMQRQGMPSVESVAIFLLTHDISHDEGASLVALLQGWDKVPVDVERLLEAVNDCVKGTFRFDPTSLAELLRAIVRQIDCAHCKRILNELSMAAHGFGRAGL